jgi:hypothetical protein
VFCEENIHFCCIIVYLSVFRLHWIELFHINILRKMMDFYFCSMKKSLCFFLQKIYRILRNLTLKRCDINCFLFQINVISINRTKKWIILAIFLIFKKIISRLRFFNLYKSVNNSMKRFFYSPFLTC